MRMRISVEGKTYDVHVEVLDGDAPPPPAAAPTAAPASAGVEVNSPIAGDVLDVKVQPGEAVEANQVLLVLEAMKMESNVVAPGAGTVGQVHVKAGDSVTAGQLLITL